MTGPAFVGARPLIASLLLTPLLLAGLAGLWWYQVPGDKGLGVAEPADSELTLGPSAPSLELVGQIGGIGSGLAVQEPYAYVGVGPRLIVVDVSNPALPRPVGQSRPLSANVRRVVADGLYAFVAAAEGTLTVLDLSNPADPVIVASLHTPGSPQDLARASAYLYLAERPRAPGNQQESGGLLVIDVSDPKNPVEVGTFYQGKSVSAVAVSGQLGLVATTTPSGSEPFLRILDLRDPARPEEVASLDMQATISGVTAADHYAFVVVWVGRGGAQLRVIDLIDPSAPVEIGRAQSGLAACCVEASGTFAYVAGAGLQVFDVSSPSRPAMVGSFRVGQASGLRVIRTLTYVTHARGLEVINIGDPAAPVLAGSYGTLGYAEYLAVTGHYAYVAGEGPGLRILDISDPGQPLQVGSYATSGAVIGVAATDRYAYMNTRAVWDGKSFVGQGMYVLDISDPVRPRQVGYLDPQPGLYKEKDIYGLTAVRNYVYIAGHHPGLRVVDVTDPARPVEVGSMDAPGLVYNVAVAGHYALLAEERLIYRGEPLSPGGLRIADISDPTNPVDVGYYEAPGHRAAVAVSGDYAFLAGRNLRVLDISDPLHATELATFELPPTGAWDMAVRGEHVYVADASSGLWIWRVTGLDTGASYANPPTPIAP